MIRSLRKLFGFNSNLGQCQRRPRRARPVLEILEHRLVPASYTYNVGFGDSESLIMAINQANSDNHTGTETINLAPGAFPIPDLYVFSSPVSNGDGADALPTITSDITINGNGAS